MLTDSLIKKRVLIIGSNGMLGQRLTEFYSAKSKIELMTASAEDESFFPEISYEKVDLADKKQVKKLITSFYPDVIINAAAYTNVDKSEIDKELAWAINVSGVEYIAKYASSIDTKVIHISTDYIFDGKAGPYDEKHKPNPVGYYGRSKLAGENALICGNCAYTILRTNVLYGPAKFGRPDFVKWVVNSSREKQNIKIVTDQINNPTYIDDLVQAIYKVWEYNKTGIYNIGGPEFLSRYDFTLRIAEFFELDKNLISQITTSELKQTAKRPLKSGLITLKAETEFGYKPHSVEETFLLMKKELNL